MSKIPKDKIIGYLYAEALKQKEKEIAKLQGCVLVLGPNIKHPKYSIREKIKTRTNKMWPNIYCYFPEDFKIQQKDFPTYRAFEFFLLKVESVKLILILLLSNTTGSLYELADFLNYPAIARKCHVLVNEHIGEYVNNALSDFPHKIKCETDDEMFEKAIEIIEKQILYAAQHGGVWWTD